VIADLAQKPLWAAPDLPAHELSIHNFFNRRIKRCGGHPGVFQELEIIPVVNRGERGASYVMPDLIGVNGDRAADILRSRSFRVAVVGSNPYPGVAAGVVIRQSPQAGFQIGPGEPISLEVSR